MAEGQKKPGRVEQAAEQAGAKAIGKAISSKVVNSAVGKAVGSALGAVGGTVLPVVGNVIGGVIGGAAAGAITKGVKESAKAIGALPFALANLGAQIASIFALSFTQALGAAFTFTIALAAGLAFFVAFALFIINSGAYVVPPGGGIAGGGGEPPTSSQECPEGGPAGWPVATDNGQSYYVAQGPFTQWSHTGLEAIDVQFNAPKDAIRPNYTVIATHPGVIQSMGVDAYGGLWLDMTGVCSTGLRFRTRHVHFSSISDSVVRGMRVERGFVLGIVGATGYATGPHDHYEFRAINRYDAGRYADAPFLMEPPFIPKPVTRGCVDRSATHPPCNVSVP